MQSSIRVLTTIFGGSMPMANAIAQQADEIFRTGPETLIAQSSCIVAGSVSNNQKEIVLLAQPESENDALKWVIKGQLENPRVLKGRAPARIIKFSRSEQSMFLPRDPLAAEWELTYGDLKPKDIAIIFFGGAPSESILKIIPSGYGERDLVTLVNEIIPIQANNNSVQRKQLWLAYLKHTQLDEGRRVALRALIQLPVEWVNLEPVLSPMITNPQAGTTIRSFIFGIVTFAVTENIWGVSNPQAVDFLCQQFSTEKNATLTLSYLLHIKQALSYSYDETTNSMSNYTGQRMLDCLKRRESLGPLEPPIQEQYQQIHASYPGLF